MTKARAKKGSPLLLLIVLAIVVGVVGAAIMWESQTVTYEFSVVGMDAHALDATFSGYSMFSPAAALISENLGTTGSAVLEKAFVIVYDGGSVSSPVDLTLAVTILHDGVETQEVDWTATANYICYFTDTLAADYMYLHDGLGTITEAGGVITIPNADLLTCMDYGITPLPLTNSKTDAGGIVLQFVFDTGEGPDALWGDFAVSIIASLGGT